MKRTLSAIAFVSIISLLGGTVNAIPSEKASPEPTTTNETTEKLDLGLLVRATTGGLQSDILKVTLFKSLDKPLQKLIYNFEKCYNIN